MLGKYMHKHCDAATLVTDFKGFGWGTNNGVWQNVPCTVYDGDSFSEALPGLIEATGLPKDIPVVLWGNSGGATMSTQMNWRLRDHESVNVVGHITDKGQTTSPLNWENCDTGADPCGLIHKAHECTVPLLILAAENDTGITPRTSEIHHAASGSKDKRLLVMPDIHHCENIPDEFLEVIVQFVTGCAAGTSPFPGMGPCRAN